ncbi:MAG TPA: hypothetical protein VEG26_10465 [Steroidobacteraceae bacterium]|nr:hypothetical protein [Steroidobacteraceae bacterium]
MDTAVSLKKTSRRAAAVAACLASLCAACPARAVDLVPFAGFRFGGYLDTTSLAVNPQGPPSSLTLNGALSYGGLVDVPISGPTALELYYSRQPTSLNGGGSLAAPPGDVTVSVMHLGLVETVPSDDPQLSWFATGTFGATRFDVSGGNLSRASLGLGGGFVWMPSKHIGLRADLRAILTFGGGGGSSIACSGGCSVAISSSAIAQGEITLGILVRL